MAVNITLVGSKWFGSAALATLLEEGVKVLRVIVPAADDRLATAARAAGIDAFVQAFLKLGSFHRSSAFYTWLYRIAFNVAISRRRRRKVERLAPALHRDV